MTIASLLDRWGNAMLGDLSIKGIRGNTGREGMHLVDSVPTAHAEVQAFVMELCETEPACLNYSARVSCRDDPIDAQVGVSVASLPG